MQIKSEDILKEKNWNFLAYTTFVLLDTQVCSRIFGVGCFVSKHLLNNYHPQSCAVFLD